MLANRRSGDRARLLALAQLAHFIGDIHQPLHAADNNDRGGNDVLVIYMGSTTFVGADGLSRAHNLHGFWDGPLVAVALGNDPIVAHEMIESLMRAHARAWSIGNPMQWAAESHSIAVRFTYGALPWETVCGARPATPVSISDEYVRSAVPIVREQLARAALRLARELNAALP